MSDLVERLKLAANGLAVHGIEFSAVLEAIAFIEAQGPRLPEGYSIERDGPDFKITGPGGGYGYLFLCNMGGIPELFLSAFLPTPATADTKAKPERETLVEREPYRPIMDDLKEAMTHVDDELQNDMNVLIGIVLKLIDARFRNLDERGA